MQYSDCHKYTDGSTFTGVTQDQSIYSWVMLSTMHEGVTGKARFRPLRNHLMCLADTMAIATETLQTVSGWHIIIIHGHTTACALNSLTSYSYRYSSGCAVESKVALYRGHLDTDCPLLLDTVQPSMRSALPSEAV